MKILICPQSSLHWAKRSCTTVKYVIKDSLFFAESRQFCIKHLFQKCLCYYPGVTNRNFPETPLENSERRQASEMEVHETSEASDLDGNLCAEDQSDHSFNKYKLHFYSTFDYLALNDH